MPVSVKVLTYEIITLICTDLCLVLQLHKQRGSRKKVLRLRCSNGDGHGLHGGSLGYVSGDLLVEL